MTHDPPFSVSQDVPSTTRSLMLILFKGYGEASTIPPYMRDCGLLRIIQIKPLLQRDEDIKCSNNMHNQVLLSKSPLITASLKSLQILHQGSQLEIKFHA